MDIQEAARRYRAGETSTALASEAGIAPSTMCNRLRRAGVELRGKGSTPVFDPDKLRRLFEMRAAGDKLEYVAAILGVSVSACAVQIRMQKTRAAREHRPVLMGLLEQLRRGLESCRAGLELPNLDRTTRKRYASSVAKFEAQVAALESVT